MCDELQRIYDSEINVRIECLWDGGWQVAIGDEMNGLIKHDGSIKNAEGIISALQALIREHHPKSAYALSLMA